MKFSLIPYRVLSLLFLLLFCTGNVLAKECRNYSFLNKGKNNLTEFFTVDELKEGRVHEFRNSLRFEEKQYGEGTVYSSQ